MKLIAVIGANYGDEGKGRIVDALATPDTIVVRYNGGAQAGHTVLRNGIRRVFNQFGAGTLVGAPTFLGPQFVCNPIMFRKEHSELLASGVLPSVYVDPRCRVTTPFDIMANQQLELARGAKRHGSCGLGFHETVLRDLTVSFNIARILGSGSPRTLLRDCRDYTFQRLEAQPNWKGLPSETYLALMSEALLERYLDDLAYMLNFMQVSDLNTVAGNRPVIFEGAQGLALDEVFGFFPHVTHSRTGLPYIEQLMNEIQETELEAIYVTRPYLTRHGAGPLPGEHKQPIIADKTNVKHRWQGKFRTGELDLTTTSARIKSDLDNVSIKPNVSLALTCADQIGEAAVPLLSNLRKTFEGSRVCVSYGEAGALVSYAGVRYA